MEPLTSSASDLKLGQCSIDILTEQGTFFNIYIFNHCDLPLIQEVLKETFTQKCYIRSLSTHPLQMEGGMEFQSP